MLDASQKLHVGLLMADLFLLPYASWKGFALKHKNNDLDGGRRL